MRTHKKLVKFISFVNWINIYYDENVAIMPLDSSNLSTNYWLAGMVDADGCFNIRLSIKRIEIAFYLEQ